MVFQIGTGGLEVAEGRFATGERQVHQATGGAVDVDQEGARRRTILEPAMIAAINLDQLAEASSAITWLVHLRRSCPTRRPQAGIHHDAPNRFLG